MFSKWPWRYGLMYSFKIWVLGAPGDVIALLWLWFVEWVLEESFQDGLRV